MKGRQAVEWGLVDAIAPQSRFAELVRTRARARAAESDRPAEAAGVELPVFGSTTVIDATGLRGHHVSVTFDRGDGVARFEVSMARLVPALARERGDDKGVIAKAAQDAFGKDKDSDKVRITVEGGPALKVRVSTRSQVIKFLSLIQEKK